MNYAFFKDINNWQDFDDKLSGLGNKEKGDAFELLTKCYFKIKPQYNHYDEVWLLDEVPQKELDYLKIPSHDLGIDLIAKEGKEYYAIQCKYHGDKNQNITFKEVSTFLQQVESNKRIAMGYICSSASGTSKNYQKVQKKEIQEILADSWQLLDKVFFDNVRKLLNNKVVIEKPFEPRSHQEKAIKQALNHFVDEDNPRGKLIFPCGAGKSLTGYWLSEALESKSTLIAVPSLSLVKQTLEVYLREIVANGIKVKWLCICSDEGIGASDDVAIMTNNIGVPCKTDPEYIRAWLKENKDEHKIIFTTYHSGHLIADISKKLKLSFDLGIFDEAHKTVGSSLKKFSYLLFEKNIKIDKRIFMTATERFYSGSKEDIVSMDDNDVYGDTFAHMSFKEAIDLNLLTDYKIITIDIKKSEIADFIRQNDKVQLNDKWKKVTESRSLASMLAMRKAMKKFNIKNVVSFHSTIEKAKRSKELQEYITDTYNYKPIDTYTVSGKIPTAKRNIIVQEFAKSERALITNARCLTEGIDVPNIDCIVFADPRKSKVDIVQALGRALRKKEGKEWGYVILPVVYDGDTNEIDNDSFNEIINIVRGLAANDERIVEYFKDKAQKGKGSVDMIKGSSLFTLDSSMLEEKDLASQLQIKIWEKLSRFNWLPFEEAREIVRGLKFDSTTEFRDYCNSDKANKQIPSRPERAYKDNGWKSMPDWLGKNKGFDGTYLTFNESRSYALDLKFRTNKDWREYCKSGNKPYNIPSNPAGLYKESGWKGWGDFLGTGNRLKIGFLRFASARTFVRDLELKSQREWKEYCKSDDRPSNIPTNPHTIYNDKGWINIGDWLGTYTIAPQNKQFVSFKEARIFAKSLKLNSAKEWRKFSLSGKRPFNIPGNPPGKYKDEGWLGWLDFLEIQPKYLDFIRAREYARSLNIQTGVDWGIYCKLGEKPSNIPNAPQYTYKNKGWVSMKDWLGDFYLDFKSARKIVRELKLKNNTEWKAFLKSGKLPANIPKSPRNIYKDKGWISLGDWIGTERVADSLKVFRDFNAARSFVRKLKLKSGKEWSDYCKSNQLPEDIPKAPRHVYKNKGWISRGDWLGTGRVADQLKSKDYKSFNEARKYVCNLNLKNATEWRDYARSNKRPDFIPGNPKSYYKDKGWLSIPDWLGTRKGWKTGVYLSFNEAREYARKLKLMKAKEWHEHVKSTLFPANIPKIPGGIYKDFKGWNDWLGTPKYKDKDYLDFNSARSIVRRFKLKNNTEWGAFCKSGKLPSDVPKAPNIIYKDKGWNGLGDWLGTGRVADGKQNWATYEEAKIFAEENNIKSKSEWSNFKQTNKLPNNIPSSPYGVYKRKKAWISWGDFFSKE